MNTFECPSREVPGLDHWRSEGLFTYCSHCGSIHPDYFNRLLDDFKIFQTLDCTRIYFVGTGIFFHTSHFGYLPKYKANPLIYRVKERLWIKNIKDIKI